jgi:hypothetical protein
VPTCWVDESNVDHSPSYTICVVATIFVVTLGVWVAWSQSRLSSEERLFVGTWVHGEGGGRTILDFRPDRTVHWKWTAGGNRTGHAKWHIDDSELKLDFSGFNRVQEVLVFVRGHRWLVESFPILVATDESIVLVNSEGKLTLTPCDDAELANVP